MQTNLQLNFDPQQEVTLRLSVVTKLPAAHPPKRKKEILDEPYFKKLQLADPDLGGALDVIIGSLDAYWEHSNIIQHMISLSLPLYSAGQLQVHWITNLLLQYSNFKLKKTLSIKHSRIWELDKTPESHKLSLDDEAALFHFLDTHQIHSDGRYIIQLPMMSDAPAVGESRHIALQHFKQNEKSLEKRASSRLSMTF